jgi:hypothetical protein
VSPPAAQLRALAARIAAGDAPSQLAKDLSGLSGPERAQVYDLAWLPRLRRVEFEEATRRRLRRRYQRTATTTRGGHRVTDEQIIMNAARRIDPHTAVMVWWYAEVLDPYGREELEPSHSCIGRQYFLVDPDAGVPVWEPDVRPLHPGISDAEWNGLMREAAARDDSHDPLPFHAYRRPRKRGGRAD